MIEETQTPMRWHGLDALRAMALFLGIVLHGSMSFMEPRAWLIDDVSFKSANVVFYVIHMFRMVLFFMLAGFFARYLIAKSSLLGFLGNRARRLLPAFAIFWVISLVAIIAFAILANPPVPGQTPAPPPPLTAETFPLTHLWFLYALLLLYVATVLVLGLLRLIGLDRPLAALCDTIFNALLRTDLIGLFLAVPVGLALYFMEKWPLWFGIPTPDHGFIPNVGATAAFTTAYLFGWYLHRNQDSLLHLGKRWWAYLWAAIIGSIWCLNMVGTNASFDVVAGNTKPLYVALYSLTAFAWSLGLIGFSQAFLNQENKISRYLSDSAYFVYLIHISVVMALQYAVLQLNLMAEVKFTIISLGATIICLILYQLMVRHTFIGAILSGHKRAKKTKEA